MKKFLTAVLLLFVSSVYSQGIYTPANPSTYGTQQLRSKSFLVTAIPYKNSLITNTTDTAPQIFYLSTDSSIWAWSLTKGFFKIGSGSGGSVTIPQNTSGTISQLRSMTTSTGLLYFSTDIPGTWADDGLNDGRYGDDGGKYLITSNGHVLIRQNPTNEVRLSWFGAGTTANLNKALVYNNKIVIDEPLSITSNVTINPSKVIEFEKGAMVTTTGGSKLLIQGHMSSGVYQIFDSSANVKVRPYSVLEIYPEWWGAVALSNPRLGSVSDGAIDATNPVKKAVFATEGEIYGDKARGALVRFNAWFGVSDQILVKGATQLLGKSPEFESSGLRWLGTGDSSKSILLLEEAEFSSIKDMGFRGRGSSNEATMLRSAIELHFLYATMQTQRKITIQNIIIGNPIGYFAGDNTGMGGGYDFKRGIYVSGDAGNNDFHLVEGLFIADTDIGIDNASDQAVEMEINGYQKNYGGVMYRSQLGGSVIGDRWYAEATDGVFDIGGTIAQEIRIGMTNLSTEYLASNYFIKSNAKVRLEVSGESYFSVNPNMSDSADGFALIKGQGGAGLDANYKFSSVRFAFNPGYEGKTLYPGYVNPTPRMYIDQSYSVATSKSVIFDNCSGMKDYMYFKFPVSYDPNNSNYTFLTFRGENNANGVTGNFYQHDKTMVVNVKNPNITQGTAARWLSIEPLFNGETDIPNNTVNIGEKGKTITLGLSVKGYKATTLANTEQLVNGILPAHSIIKSVTVKTEDANTLPYFFSYVTVGTIKNEKQFGTVAMPNAGAVNTSPATLYFTDTAEPLILKAWRDRSPTNSFTLSGTSLSASFPASFETTSVGGIVRFSSGKEVLITGYTDDSHVTVANPDSYTISGEHAIVQEKLASGKNLTLNIAYEEVQKSVGELDINYAPSLPSVTMVSKTPVLNEKQYIIGPVDPTTISGTYTLAPATSSTLGGIKVGTGLSVDGSGNLMNTGVLSETDLMHKTSDEVVDGSKTMVQNFTVATSNSISKIILKNDAGKNLDIGMAGDAFGGYGPILAKTAYLHNVFGDIGVLSDITGGKIKLSAGGASSTQVTVSATDVTSTVPVNVPAATATTHAVNLGQIRDSNYLRAANTEVDSVNLKHWGDATGHTVTGTTSETTVYSRTVPANTLGANGYMKLEYFVEMGSAFVDSGVVIKIYFGGEVIVNATLGAVRGYQCMSRYSNRGSQVSGFSPWPDYNFQATGTMNLTRTYEINTSIDQPLTVTITNSVSGKSTTLQDFQVFFYQN